MNRDLHTDPEKDITASEGWLDMRLLLDKQLPVQEVPAKRRPLFYYLAAASCILLLLLSYLQLQQGIIPAGFSGSDAANTKGQKNIPVRIDPSIFAGAGAKHQQDMLYAKNNHSVIYKTSTFFKQADVNNTVADTDVTNSTDLIATDNKTGSRFLQYQRKNMTAIGYGYTPLDKLGDAERYTAQDKNTGSDPVAKDPKKKQHNSGSWEFAAGIGINAVLHQSMNAQPYPAALIKYDISPKVYLAMGITAWSPVNSSARGVSKTVYVNDTANNLRSYNEVTRYTRFHYADMRLVAGVNLTKRLSVQGGLQASLLMNKKDLTTYDGYDFQMNPLGISGNPLGLSPVSSTDVETSTRQLDYRLTGGLLYTVNKVSLNLSYQQGLQSPVYGAQVSSGKNKVVSLQVLYSIKN